MHHGTVEIDFSNDPFSFLLIFCDECQEWGRPIKTQKEKWACELEYITIRIGEGSIAVHMDYLSSEILKATGFNESIFRESKKKTLDRLYAPFSIQIIPRFPD